MEPFSKEFIKKYFIRNKKLFIISLLILIVPAIVGLITTLLFGIGSSNQLPLSSLFASSNVALNPNLTFTGLLYHNVVANLVTIALGLLFSVISVCLVAYNGFMVGLMFGVDPIFAFLGLMPHGIFEFPASIFALVGSFIVTKFVIELLKGIFTKNKTVKGVFTESTLVYKDILLTIVIIIILLVIAAYIETYITPICITSYIG